MKKIVRQQNYLKELINSQNNKIITRQYLKCIIRAVLEPLIDNPEEGVVLHRIINISGITGLIKRLEFSNIKSINFSDESGNLKEKVWADTEFLCVMTHRFVSIVIWDNKTDNKNYVRYYSVWNSKLQNEALDIIARNSNLDIKEFQESFKPDRRDNYLLNSSIRRMIENMDEAGKDAVLGFAEFQAKPVEYTSDVREVAHEIKNQLSICDLYSEIIKKYCDKNKITDETILKGIGSIAKAVKMCSNSLNSLKATEQKELVVCDIKSIVNIVQDLTKVYFECNNVEYKIESKANLKINADEESLVSVLVNLVKNAIEAFKDEKCPKDGKYIKIKAEKRGDFGVIRVINNAIKIDNPELIFKKGYTTKQTGSGLGLSICKRTIEQMGGELSLAHTGDDCTEFLIKMELLK